jgi:hypothetical protein
MLKPCILAVGERGGGKWQIRLHDHWLKRQEGEDGWWDAEELLHSKTSVRRMTMKSGYG